MERIVPGTLHRVVMPIDLIGDSKNGTVGPLKSSLAEPTVVTSLLGNGLHAPVIDIDVPHALVPSSTPGKGHLYLDVPMSTEKLMQLLKVMADVGVVEHGYYAASRARGFSAVRLPWVKKGV